MAITGLVVPPENSSALAAAVCHYLSQNLEPRFRANIQQTNQRFSWHYLQDALEALTQS